MEDGPGHEIKKAIKMMAFATIAILAGAALGLRFKVLILIPALIFGLPSIAALEFMRGADIDAALLAIVASAVALQIGYLLGAVARFVLGAMQIPRAHPGVFGKTAH